MSSADHLCKNLDSDQARRKVGPDLDPNCLTLFEFPERVFFSKKLILTKHQQATKMHEKIPNRQSPIYAKGSDRLALKT